MAHRIATDFHAEIVNGRVERQRFLVEAAEGRIAVEGGMSTGRGRWRLSASAVLHRRRITLQVLARLAEAEAACDDVTDHAYSATLHGLKPGAYQLRVTHVIHAPELGLSSESLPACEATVEVGESKRVGEGCA
jgi:hypothetical protein